MRNPDGIRAESKRSPNASRAGALHSHIHSHLYRQIGWAEGPIHRFGSRGPGSRRMDGGYAEIRDER